MENNSTKNGDDAGIGERLKERAERNRQRALLIKKSKIISHPYARYVLSLKVCGNMWMNIIFTHMCEKIRK